MIIVSKNGKTYELTREDQEEIRLMAIANGGNVELAIATFHEKKFGEPFPAYDLPADRTAANPASVSPGRKTH